jgi:lysozyme family protein
MGWANNLAYAAWKATLKGDEGNCAQWRKEPANQKDRGGLTHWGVIRKTWIAYAKKYGWDPTERGQCNMTDRQFETITANYWLLSGASKMKHPGVAILAASIQWGTGGIYALQRALNAIGYRLAVDGVPGTNTLAAINASKPSRLIPQIQRAYKDVLLKTTDPVFHAGLISRVDRLVALAYDAESNAQTIRYDMRELKIPSFDTPQKETDWTTFFVGLAIAGASGYMGYRFYKKKSQS